MPRPSRRIPTRPILVGTLAMLAASACPGRAFAWESRQQPNQQQQQPSPRSQPPQQQPPRHQQQRTGWADVREAGPFVVRADFMLQGSEQLVLQLAQLQSDLSRALGVPTPKERIELLLFRDEATYRRFLRANYPNVPYRRALYVKNGGLGRVLVQRSDQFEVDVRHECTHALLHASLPMVPLWLDEGLAEYFELPPRERAYGNPYLAGLRWNATWNVLPNLPKLEGRDDFSKLTRNDYRDSWAWVHFMLHGPEAARRELTQFLADIRASNPPGRLSDRLVSQMPDVRSQLAQHLKTWKKPGDVRQADRSAAWRPFAKRW